MTKIISHVIILTILLSTMFISETMARIECRNGFCYEIQDTPIANNYTTPNKEQNNKGYGALLVIAIMFLPLPFFISNQKSKMLNNEDFYKTEIEQENVYFSSMFIGIGITILLFFVLGYLSSLNPEAENILGVLLISIMALGWIYFLWIGGKIFGIKSAKNAKIAKERYREKQKERQKQRKIMDGMSDKCKLYAKKRKKSEVITLHKELNSIIDNLDQELSEIRDLSRNLREYSANIIKSTLGMPENLLLGGFAIKRFNRDDSDFDYVKNLTLKEIRGRESNITKLKEIYNKTIVTLNILDEEKQDFEELKFYVNEKMMEYLEAVCYRIQVNTQTFDKTNDSKGFYALNVSRVIECEPELNTDKLYNVQSTQIKQFGTKARVNVIINGAYKIPACVFYTYKIFDQGSNIFEGIGNSASYGGNLRV